MLARLKRLWEIPESAATDEKLFLDRRHLCRAIAIGPAFLAGGVAGPAWAAAKATDDPTVDLYPVKRNEKYLLEPRTLTEEGHAITYNNFFEFGSHKRIAKTAQKLKIRPWTITIIRMVEKEMTVDFDDLISKMPLE